MLSYLLETFYLYMTPGGNSLYALVRGLCTGLTPGGGKCYLFHPGGLFCVIPTKTPVLPYQFLVSCRSSFRHLLQVLLTFVLLARFPTLVQSEIH